MSKLKRTITVRGGLTLEMAFERAKKDIEDYPYGTDGDLERTKWEDVRYVDITLVSVVTKVCVGFREDDDGIEYTFEIEGEWDHIDND